MAGTITRLRTAPDRARQEAASEVRQALLSFPDLLPPHDAARIAAALDRQATPVAPWVFVMISPTQHAAVVEHLAAHSRRKLVALRLWALVLEHLDTRTGEIGLTREQMAAKLGVRPGHVSEVMTELEGIEAVSRHREAVPGVKGSVVRHFLNPLVGTHLPGAARQRAQAEAPALRLIPSSAP